MLGIIYFIFIDTVRQISIFISSENPCQSTDFQVIPSPDSQNINVHYVILFRIVEIDTPLFYF